MHRHLALALFALLAPAALAQEAIPWREEDPNFGAFSGLIVSADGGTFTVVSDRAHIATGRFERGNGRLTGAKLDTLTPLLNPRGKPIGGRNFDAESLTLGPDGTLYIAFESNHRVWAYASPTDPAKPLPKAEAFARFQNNSGLEALFTGPDGALYALPERSGRLSRPFPVFRFDGQTWTQPFTIPRRPPHLPTGADIGPDGRLYLLERDFRGLRGFSTRIRSFAFTPRGVTDEQTILTSRLGTYDNLEGIAAWEDPQGNTRLILISDDNMKFFQRTEWVEVIVPRTRPLRPRIRPPA